MRCTFRNCRACTQALESEAETAARRKRVADALRNYKQAAGLEVDPRAEAAAKAVYARGEALMQRVRLSAESPCCARGPCIMMGGQCMRLCLLAHKSLRERWMPWAVYVVKGAAAVHMKTISGESACCFCVPAGAAIGRYRAV
jgi:hypothetical protein